MSRKGKIWLAGIGAAYLAGASTLVIRGYLSVPDMFSSPTEPRDSMEYRDGTLGVFKPADRDLDDDFPAETPMSVPVRVPSDGSDILFDWKGEPGMVKKKQPDRWTPALEGDDQIDLEAFAVWYPASDDPLDSEGTTGPVTFGSIRDAKTLAVLDPAGLEARGIPASFREMTPPKQYRAPVLRLMFRTTNMPVVRLYGGKGGDARTGAQVTFDLQANDNSNVFFGQTGDWSWLDVALVCWHDTPLKVSVLALTGEPQFAALPQRLGEEVVFSNCLRIQWLDQFDGSVQLKSGVNSFEPAAGLPEPGRSELIGRLKNYSDTNKRVAWLQANKPPTDVASPGPSMVVRANSDTYLRYHCGWSSKEDGGFHWNWSREGEEDQMLIASAPAVGDPATPLRLVYLPKATELNWEIAGLPDAPNPREITDLFDARLPRITLPENPSSAEDHLIGFLAAATQFEWENGNLWDDQVPSALPGDRTFRDITPQELAAWYLKNTPGATLRRDEDQKLIFFNEEKESWWERFKDWADTYF
jgi:hypothetical protein